MFIPVQCRNSKSSKIINLLVHSAIYQWTFLMRDMRPYNFTLHQHPNEGLWDQAQMDAKSAWSPTWQQKNNDAWSINICC